MKEIKNNKVEATRRVQITFTLKNELRDRFNYFCSVNFTNKSQLLESLLEQYLDQHPIEYPNYENK